MNYETLLPIGSLLALISVLVSGQVMSARSLRTTTQAAGELAKTNMALNSELKESIKERRASEDERLQQGEQIRELASENNLLKGELQQVRREMVQHQEDNQRATAQDRADSKRAIDQLGQELVKVKMELAGALQEAKNMKDSIGMLTGALQAAQDRVKELEAREQLLREELSKAQTQIARLERDNLAKDSDLKELQGRVRDLETELKKTQEERTALEQANADLVRQLAAMESEPGEANTPTPEPSEESEKGE